MRVALASFLSLLFSITPKVGEGQTLQGGPSIANNPSIQSTFTPPSGNAALDATSTTFDGTAASAAVTMTTTRIDTIICFFSFARGTAGLTFTPLTDEKGQIFQPLYTLTGDSTNGRNMGSYYLDGESPGAHTFTLTLTASATLALGCAGINAPANHAADTTFTFGQNQDAATANATAGAAQTPTSANEIVFAFLSTNTATTFTTGMANSLFSLGTTHLYVGYTVQTTATATTCPWTNTATNWLAACVAIASPFTGNCDFDFILAGSGNNPTSGTSLTTGNVQAAISGLVLQANGQGTQQPPGTVSLNNSGAGSATFDNSAPYTTIRTQNCPYYQGTGSNTNSVGETFTSVGGSSTANDAQVYFDSDWPAASWGGCFTVDFTTSVSSTNDTAAIEAINGQGNLPYANFLINGNGTHLYPGLENGASTLNTPTNNAIHLEGQTIWATGLVTNYLYGPVLLQVYTSSTSNCNGSLTLQTTLSNPNTKPGPYARFGVVGWIGVGPASWNEVGKHVKVGFFGVSKKGVWPLCPNSPAGQNCT